MLADARKAASKPFPIKHPLDSFPKFPLQGPWREDVDSGPSVSSWTHFKDDIRHLLKAKSIKCRTSVFLRLILSDEDDTSLEFFVRHAWIIATDIRQAKLGWLLNFLRYPQGRKSLADTLLDRLENQGRLRTDDLTL